MCGLYSPLGGGGDGKGGGGRNAAYCTVPQCNSRPHEYARISKGNQETALVCSEL